MSAAFPYARTPVQGFRGVVVSGHPLATSAGISVLASGGNAVDALLTAAGVLCVVRPAWCSLGGDGFLLVRTAAGTVHALNGSGGAPALATPDRFPAGRVPRFGPTSIAVPGLPDVLDLAAQRFASRPLPILLAPAIDYAEHGFPAGPSLIAAIRTLEPVLAEHPALAALLRPGGELPRPGQPIRQLELAESLRAFAAEGRGWFYEGDFATALDRWSREAGGLLRRDDLAQHRTVWQAPIAISYRDRYQVLTTPPVSYGSILLAELNIFERFDPTCYEPGSAPWIDLMVGCKQAAFADAKRYLGDPHFVEIPIDWLLSKERAAHWAAALRARTPEVYQPAATAAGNDTDCVVAADAAGNVACLIQSVFNLFGSREVVPGTGILLNDRLANVPVAPAHPNGLRPSKRPLSTLNAYLVLDLAGEVVLAGASPGGQGQVQTNFQVAVRVLDYGLDAQAAVDAPRWLSGSPFSRSAIDELFLEDRFPEGVPNALRALGHTVVVTDPHRAEQYGSACIITRDPATRAWSAGADPRRDACAIAC